MLNAHNADVYTDFNGLAKLKTEAKSNSPEAIKEVAKQFESVFLNMVLKSMRQAKLSDGLLDNDQSEFYQDMYDQQLAVHLSGEPGIGLAELIARQLSPKEQKQQESMDVEDYLNRSVAPAVRPPVKQSEQIPISAVNSAVDSVEEAGGPSATSDAAVKNVNERPLTSQAQFVAHLRPYAEQAASELGVDAGVLLAQAALETGWGKAVLKYADGSSSHNLFNIKADRSWRGNQVGHKTVEFADGIGRQEMAAFRAYDSYRDSFKDYVRFVKGNPRYANAMKMAGNPERYMHELQRAGYATDPTYAAKVMRIYHGQAIGGGSDVVAMK
ncbi:flagellar assembly peptidoglycan hydrolase FlgJ [Methylomarinum vadi]|uniref:flagellar assembly peptidoglycan hydrolase FlgJ n=1 Tax=Methylomarinum vadi TaxID=438855 RepID=UPI0004DF98C8|nr:flagellar assembly peptidoglycan hydrolase FlgJ [Methylomarinum vadi]